jgi:hypothetical protein
LLPNQLSVILLLKPPPESPSSNPFPFKTLLPKTGGSKPHSQKIKKAKNLVTCLWNNLNACCQKILSLKRVAAATQSPSHQCQVTYWSTTTHR